MAINWSLLNPSLPAEAKTVDAFGALQAGQNQALARQDQQQTSALRALQLQTGTQALKDKQAADQAERLMALSLEAHQKGDLENATKYAQQAAAADLRTTQTLAAQYQQQQAAAATATRESAKYDQEQAVRAAPLVVANRPKIEQFFAQNPNATPEQASAFLKDTLGEFFDPRQVPAFMDPAKRQMGLEHFQQVWDNSPEKLKKDADERAAEAERRRRANEDRDYQLRLRTEERLAAGGNGSAEEKHIALVNAAYNTPEAQRTPVQKGLIAQFEKKGAPAGGGNVAGGARNLAFTNRVVTGLAGVEAGMHSLWSQPSTAGTGAAGVASGDPSTFAGAASNWMKGALNSDEQTNYNTAWTGLNRHMATAEASGLVPSGAFTHAFDALRFSTNDSPSERLHKLVQVRVDTDAVATTKLADQTVSPTQQEAIRQMQAKMARRIPFTIEEVSALGDRAIPMRKDMTLAQWIAANEKRMVALGIRKPAAKPAPAASTNPFGNIGVGSAPAPQAPAAPARPAQGIHAEALRILNGG
jgi:hypothetical protein